MPFAPTDLSGLKAWYAMRLEVYANMAAVTILNDQSASNNDATAVVAATFNTLQINGNPALVFSGVGSPRYTFGTAINLQTASTCFFVTKLSSVSAKSTLLSGDDGCLTWNQVDTGTLHGSDKSNQAGLGKSTSVANTGWNQMNITYNNTTITFRTNRAADGSASPSAAIVANSLLIGCNQASLGEQYTGQLAEMLIYDRVLNGTEIGQVEDYLNTIYFVFPTDTSLDTSKFPKFLLRNPPTGAQSA